MKKNPAVSVVVPIYNVERYIKFCVDSILAQRFQDFEIILVDDASPDNSFELCQKFYGNNPKVKFVRHEKNLGLGEARNTGIRHATGKYVCFVDSDDFILPYALEKLFDTAEQNNAQVVHAAAWYELHQNEPFPVNQKNLKLKTDGYVDEGFLQKGVAERLPEHLNYKVTAPMAWLYFCRRDFLAEHDIKFLPVISEDEPFHLAMLLFAERYFILLRPTHIYRKRDDSIMSAKPVSRLDKAIKSSLTVALYVKKLLDAVPKFDGFELWREEILNLFFYKFMDGHTRFFYEGLSVAPQTDDTVRRALTSTFGDNEDFVRYYFNGFHTFRRKAELLMLRSTLKAAELTDLFKRIPLSERKIVFVNFMGRGFGCNPKYIALEIIRQGLPCDLVWLVNDINEPMPAQIRKVKYGSLDSIYEIATARVIISNVKNLLPFPDKKRGQFFIMTWHGGTAFKYIEKDAEAKLSPAYLAETKANSKITDLMIADSQEEFDEFKRVMYYDGEILKCGLPRNDIFFRRDEVKVAQIRQTLNVPPDHKVILYAPTFRNNPKVTAAACTLDAQKLLAAVRKRFGGEWTLLLRYHPNVASFFNKENSDGNVINATTYPDMQELILISDVLVSDYSSVICDFMFIGKPVFVYAADFDAYIKERGFKPLFFELPYKVNRSESELFADIETYDLAALKPGIKRFIETVKPFDDGHASEKVVEQIKIALETATPSLSAAAPSNLEAFS